jgi:hypothetical protein
LTEFTYNATPTVGKFMRSQKFGRFISGPVGSGKTTGMIMEILRRAGEQEPGPNGLRMTRWAIVRNTMQQLRTTILPDIQQILQPIVRFYTTESTIQIRAGDIHADLLLMPLDDVDDQRRLLSTQLTGAWLSEFREIDFRLLAPLAGRIGRYPSRAVVPPTWYGIIGETNSFNEGSEWHRFLVLECPSEYEFFRQPSGLSPDAENVENLPANYYQRLAEGQSEEWAKVYIENEFGHDLSGQSVFRASFNYEFHVTRGLQINPMRPVGIAMDFGRTPAALFWQLTPDGRLQVYDEITSEDMGLEQFTKEKLLPMVQTPKYSGRDFFVVGDPSGAYKSQISDMSCFDVLRSAGFRAYPAATNDVAPRLRAVESLLLQNRGGKPALQIDETGCPTFVKAMRSDYRYKRLKTGELNPSPEKNYASHIADAGQYMCLAVALDLPGRIMKRQRAVSAPPPPAGAWT